MRNNSVIGAVPGEPGTGPSICLRSLSALDRRKLRSSGAIDHRVNAELACTQKVECQGASHVHQKLLAFRGLSADKDKLLDEYKRNQVDHRMSRAQPIA